ncbi:envelope glycoprotein B-1 [Leporid alphaherpesvirus 4]|uniref:Envelope glycoprotein B-1 n=1 Tax=Leporid alphaherpesvirus 4 TaxID=481315 RepID=J9QWL4_9ALPH|nr:envelope glycoprotein B-1 [Leporid alphaherpesvirus 4]AFR32469.1 envelope glycoprotein B-1 [Leporid alphaherpesvirus 4]
MRLTMRGILVILVVAVPLLAAAASTRAAAPRRARPEGRARGEGRERGKGRRPPPPLPSEPAPTPLLQYSTGAPTNASAPANSAELREEIRALRGSSEDPRFYVCPPPTGATVIRLEEPRACPDAPKGLNFTEGIAVIFKENLAPYKFKATMYYKAVTVSKVWSGYSYSQLTNIFEDRAPIPFEEIVDRIHGRGVCLSTAKYIRNNLETTAFHNDENEHEMKLVPAEPAPGSHRGWHTTKLKVNPTGSAWVYRHGTTVNCIVDEVEAKSAYPYNEFVLATGDFVYASPFYGYRDGSHAEHTAYTADRFRQVDGFFPRNLDTGRRAQTPSTYNLLTTPSFTVGWNWAPKRPSVCTMTKWREVAEMLRAEYGSSFRFSSSELSATFTTNLTEYALARVDLGECISKDAREAIDRIYTQRYNSTHLRVGSVQYYLATGGFLVAYQPLLSNSLADLYVKELLREQGRAKNDSSPRKNATEVISTTSSVEFARLQFTYDHIQRHVNEMLGRLAVSWCELQNQELTLWNEAQKLNPSAIASATVRRRVSARMLGDVLAVSTCVAVPAENVIMQNSMRMPAKPGTCYSRPLLSFKYADGGDLVEGQLGENNEIRLERDAIEPCSVGHKRYFSFGAGYVYFENYAYSHQLPRSDVMSVSTFIDLNLTMLSDHEFVPLEVYTRREIKDSGLLDYAEVQRRNQLHALRFADIDTVIKADASAAMFAGLHAFFDGLGDAGRALGSVVLGIASGVVATVTGVTSFLSNPFGALAVGLLVLAGLVAAFFALRYVMRIQRNPMKALYPLTTKDLKNADAGDKEGPAEDFDERKLEAARDMIRYMALVSAMERTKHKAKKRGGTSAILTARATDMILRRRAGAARYEPLNDEDM